MSDVRVAVVGAGILGSRYARVFHEMNNVQLVGVVDPVLEKATSVGELHGAASFGNLDELLREVECDAVAVATPDHLHFRPVMTALEHGKHVLVEKPLATDLHEARTMVEEAKRRGLTLNVNYSQRWVPEYRWIRDQIDNGVIGRPAMVLSSKQDTIFVPTRMIGWAAESSPIFFMSSHDLDLVAWFVGSRAARASAHQHRGVLEARGVAAPDGIDALVTYESGVSASYHSSWIHPNSYPHIVTDRMTIIGERGMIHFESQGRRVECYAEGGGQTITFTGPQTANEVDGRIQGAFTRSLEEFLRSIATGTESSTSAGNTLHVTATQVAIMEALTRAETVDVTL
jgi:predicted dehydrogenase